ncbi:O-methyltransferase [Paracrocinitomix mangrovi]|uniref:O-methyltransferase n=1 Tax=Paracrocinitomix mangrovi TaxID=2862509 RepID=UPI001C8D1BF8|nr:O-methyltransferase [Paracrocinitomix mangrovi]UKN02551.1 O-methyltransferase [Paracrocinitomix mangrovi]
MDFLPEKIEKYVEEHTDKENKLLAGLNRETWLKVMSPRMLSGHVQGRVLSMLSHMIQPKYILEIGTYTGYSALCMAEGLQADGRLITIDLNEELKPILDKYLLNSPYKDQIELHFGKAADIIPDLPDGIDMVFIDADKPNYATYFDLTIDKVRPGGFILADNVLWSGNVVDESKFNDKSNAAIRDFNDKVHADERVENVLFPVRDGIMVMRKK